MPTDALPLEKRIAAQFPDLDLESPPAPPRELLDPEHHPEPDAILAEPSTTRLLLEGVRHTDITVGFLTAIHDLADDGGLTLQGIAVGDYGANRTHTNQQYT